MVWTVLSISALAGITFFLLSEVWINLILRAQSPDQILHRRFYYITRDVKAQAALWFMPRLYIIQLSQPNAIAYGWGFLGQYAIGITQSLYDILDDDELEAVIAHEVAHIKCKDVGITSTFALLTDGFRWFAYLLTSGRTLMGRTPVSLLLGYILKGMGKYVFGILRSAISREREYTADALSVLYIRKPEALIRALQKLHHHSIHAGPYGPLDRLLISHPDLLNRINAILNYQLTTPSEPPTQ